MDIFIGNPDAKRIMFLEVRLEEEEGKNDNLK